MNNVERIKGIVKSYVDDKILASEMEEHLMEIIEEVYKEAYEDGFDSEMKHLSSAIVDTMYYKYIVR